MRAAHALLYVVLGCQRGRERQTDRQRQRYRQTDRQVGRHVMRCVRVQTVRSVPISELCSVTDCNKCSWIVPVNEVCSVTDCNLTSVAGYYQSVRYVQVQIVTYVAV